jgi:signal transduction histidine kinase
MSALTAGRIGAPVRGWRLGTAAAGLLLFAASLPGVWDGEGRLDMPVFLGVLCLSAALGCAAIAIGAQPGSASVGQLLAAGALLGLAAAALAALGAPAPLAVGAGLIGGLGVLPVALLRYPSGPSDRVGRWLAPPVAAFGLGAAALFAAHSPLAPWPAAIGLSAAGAGMWWRVERSGGDERRSQLWMVYGISVAALLSGHLSFLAEVSPAGPAAAGVTGASIVASLLAPACLAIGVLAPRIVDVRQLSARTALWVVMVELALAVTIGSLALWEAIAGRPAPRPAAGILAVAVAACYHPAAVRMRRILDEVMFGGSVDPVEAMAGLAQQLEAQDSPHAWLHSLRGSLALPLIELWEDGRLLIRSGEEGRPSERVELVAGSEVVGTMIVGLPGDATALPGSTRAILRLVSAPLARAVQGRALADQLQASRSEVIAVLEDERRRLRRDLHDGLGPVLTGVAYSADAARNLLRTDPDQADALLGALRDDTAGAIAEVRRIVYGLRPPALDDVGLVEAIRQRAARLRGPDGEPMEVSIRADSQLAVLPAAIEVAAYRVAIEALTNAARHAGSGRAELVLASEASCLIVDVRDAGGSREPWRAGVGIASMRERCQQLGGELLVGPTPLGGHVRARLPLT